jgi:hypothetical protein
MYAMQYEITLPADYDMDIIRRRVATRGHLLDDFPGLGLKAFLVRVRGEHDSPVNEYAPFYLWSSIAGLNNFLWGGGGFGGICADFGRPPVRHWPGVSARPGPARDAAPSVATRRTQAIAADVDPSAAVDRALLEVARRAGTPGVHSTAFAIDPHEWEEVYFTLWDGEPAVESEETRYDVLHLCRPEFDAIAAEQLLVRN